MAYGDDIKVGTDLRRPKVTVSTAKPKPDAKADEPTKPASQATDTKTSEPK